MKRPLSTRRFILSGDGNLKEILLLINVCRRHVELSRLGADVTLPILTLPASVKREFNLVIIVLLCHFAFTFRTYPMLKLLPYGIGDCIPVFRAFGIFVTVLFKAF